MSGIIQNTINNLVRRNMNGYYVQDKEQLEVLLKALIPKKAVIGSGDSVTLQETGVFDFVRKNDYVFLDKHKPGLTSKEKRELYIRNFSADVFLTGTNAVTTEGELCNIDGNGSRVAPLIYGPNKVIIIVGTNKIVNSRKEAITRTRQIAAPQDAVRLGRKTPCTTLDKCIDCKHPQRICNDFVLIAGQFDQERIHVIFLEGDYGY